MVLPGPALSLEKYHTENCWMTILQGVYSDGTWYEEDQGDYFYSVCSSAWRKEFSKSLAIEMPSCGIFKGNWELVMLWFNSIWMCAWSDHKGWLHSGGREVRDLWPTLNTLMVTGVNKKGLCLFLYQWCTGVWFMIVHSSLADQVTLAGYRSPEYEHVGRYQSVCTKPTATPLKVVRYMYKCSVFSNIVGN